MSKCNDCGIYVTAFQASYSQTQVDLKRLTMGLYRPSSRRRRLRTDAEPRCECCLDLWKDALASSSHRSQPRLRNLQAA